MKLIGITVTLSPLARKVSLHSSLSTIRLFTATEVPSPVMLLPANKSLNVTLLPTQISWWFKNTFIQSQIFEYFKVQVMVISVIKGFPVRGFGLKK